MVRTRSPRLNDKADPRLRPYSSSPLATLHILGDASEPSDGSPKIGAVLLAAGECRAFEVCVPQRLIDALPRCAKRIYYYELLWPAVAAFVWKEHLGHSFRVFYEDNEGAKFSLLKGFSSDFAASLVLAMFWGAAALQRSRPWTTRIASGDNPADCLTKDCLDRSHLSGAIWEECDLAPFWDSLVSLLVKKRFPRWSQLSELFGSSFR